VKFALAPLFVAALFSVHGSWKLQSAVAPAAAPHAPAPDEFDARFPRPKHAVALESASLAELVQRVSAATGVVYSTSTPQAQKELESKRVTLSAKAEVAPDELYPWFESLLVQHGYYLSAPLQLDPPLAALRKAGFDKPVEGDALEVPLARLEFLKQHPALQARVTLGVQHVDVRLFNATLRPLCGFDNNPTNVMPAGIAPGLVLQGPGQTLFALAELIVRIDAACAKAGDPAEATRILQREVKLEVEKRR
jgi:hypothetical protein